MIFIAISVLVPIVILTGFRAYMERRFAAQPHRWLLVVAAGLFLISWYLPSPLINGQDTSFVTHLVGGGVFSGLLGLYTYRALRLDWTWWQQAVAFYALVSALGVLNELAEFGFVALGLVDMSLSDTSWDLVANSLGAGLFFVVYRGLVGARR